jgi:transposase-like protein
MDKLISELQKRIEQATKNKANRRFFPAELRNKVVELALAWKSSGKSRRELASRLGVNDETLAYWMHRSVSAAKPKTRVRPVRVLDAETANSRPISTRSVVLPSGARIEGLAMDDLIALARALS